METRTRDLAQEAKGTVQEAQQAIKQTASHLSENARNLGNTAKQAAQAAYSTAQEKVKVGARATDDAIRGNPYSSLGIAFACGLLIGFLMKRK